MFCIQVKSGMLTASPNIRIHSKAVQRSIKLQKPVTAQTFTCGSTGSP